LNTHSGDIVGQAVIILSGAVCAGKSTLAQELVRALGARLVSARQTLADLLGKEGPSRSELVEFGEAIERETKGSWLAEAAASHRSEYVVIDAVRTRNQLARIRELVPNSIHVHVTASTVERERRFRDSDSSIEDLSFESIANHPIEREAVALGAASDLEIDTSQLSPPDSVATLLRHSGLKLEYPGS
jgi:adenylosuccinate synthase